MAALHARIDRLEERLPDPSKERAHRFIRIVANAGDKERAHALAMAEGYDPDSGDIVIVRLIAPAPGKEPRPFEPYVQSSSTV